MPLPPDEVIIGPVFLPRKGWALGFGLGLATEDFNEKFFFGEKSVSKYARIWEYRGNVGFENKRMGWADAMCRSLVVALESGSETCLDVGNCGQCYFEQRQQQKSGDLEPESEVYGSGNEAYRLIEFNSASHLKEYPILARLHAIAAARSTGGVVSGGKGRPGNAFWRLNWPLIMAEDATRRALPSPVVAASFRQLLNCISGGPIGLG